MILMALCINPMNHKSKTSRQQIYFINNLYIVCINVAFHFPFLGKRMTVHPSHLRAVGQTLAFYLLSQHHEDRFVATIFFPTHHEDHENRFATLLSSFLTHHEDHDLQPLILSPIGPSHCYHTTTIRYLPTGSTLKTKILHSSNYGFKVK